MRNELGFDGFVVSDWQDIKKLVTEWRVAADEKEATRLSVMAGVDMSMVPRITVLATPAAARQRKQSANVEN